MWKERLLVDASQAMALVCRTLRPTLIASHALQVVTQIPRGRSAPRVRRVHSVAKKELSNVRAAHCWKSSKMGQMSVDTSVHRGSMLLQTQWIARNVLLEDTATKMELMHVNSAHQGLSHRCRGETLPSRATPVKQENTTANQV